ncbi:MAG: GNAT family N-acetyltransferase [Ardenticatenaceae bacterium]|nr:GNAT family N-acetyltransferase [Anaerolineales bacterium]MCB8920998.1 GNAT family N-acetyltransferase [Ardenticatenaceae bacterium]MCB8991578.1 GNAT family N-acetyltransferase [Ardenticatenaceae bacterium]MCB9004207.1 GNAT family N-acetyltransferase [Ardenticatenaceae bacterium]
MRSQSAFSSFPDLYTPRLHLRQLRPSDAADMFAFLSDEQVTRYFGLETFNDIEEARQRIRTINASFRSQAALRWGISRREDDTLIGTCGYIYWKWRHRHAAVGYELARPFWRQGIMQETLTAVLEFGYTRMNLHRVEALVMPENTPSSALLQKLGFHSEGLLRDYGFWSGEFHNLTVYSLLRHEWQNGNG